jgi:hypothetical protein
MTGMFCTSYIYFSYFDFVNHFEFVKNACLNIREQGSVVLNTWYLIISRLQYSQREVDGSTVWHIERLSPWLVTPLKALGNKRTVLSPALESYWAARTISCQARVEFLELHFEQGWMGRMEVWLAGWWFCYKWHSFDHTAESLYINSIFSVFGVSICHSFTSPGEWILCVWASFGCFTDW